MAGKPINRDGKWQLNVTGSGNYTFRKPLNRVYNLVRGDFSGSDNWK
jgi:hypothetical protein